MTPLEAEAIPQDIKKINKIYVMMKIMLDELI